MLFQTFSNFLSQLEATSSRLEMTAILARLFKECQQNEIDKVCYLTLGQLVPKYEGVEFNMAEKLMVKAAARSLNMLEKDISQAYKESGDLGNTIKKLEIPACGSDCSTRLIQPCSASDPAAGKQKSKLTIIDVYEKLLSVAQENGVGSVERKINKMSNLLVSLDSNSCKYIVRMPIGKLRLGFSDMTILDALSWMEKGDKSLRKELENSFNVLADIGRIAQVFKAEGIKGINHIKGEVGIPIRPAKAERLANPKEILEKMKGQCVLEPKMDGFRVQIHLKREKSKEKKVKSNENLQLFKSDKEEKYFVRIFSRNLEDTTHMFPEIVEAMQDLAVKSVVLDGEAIAFDPKNGKFLPFQETVQRKRKHDILKTAQKIPLKVFVFDILNLNNQSLLAKPFLERRQLLEQIISKNKNNTLQLTDQAIVKKAKEFKDFFNKAAKEGLEGLMAKKLDSIYQAGARNFNWVKYKVGMRSDLADTIDAVVMGYYRGKGKRTGFGIGAFLVGIVTKYQKPNTKNQIPKTVEIEEFVTVSKIGTGLTDEQWREMKTRCRQWEVKDQPKDYHVAKNLYPDVWVEPKIVVEIEADTVTKSPIHTAGYALRFPRLKRFRDDKSVNEATSLEELTRITRASYYCHREVR